MTYVLGDIHGNYSKYLNILKQIKFTDKDDLYVIGDMLDIGDEPIELIRDMSMRINVFPILGDREYIALKMLTKVGELDKNSTDGFTPEFTAWLKVGGKVTFDKYMELSREEKDAFREYLADIPLYEDINVNGVRYILVHAGLSGYEKDRNLEDYGPEEMIFNKVDIEKRYFDEAILISGHKPTMDENGNAQRRAVQKNGNLCIDCGEGIGGVLCAVCLDDGREFYA